MNNGRLINYVAFSALIAALLLGWQWPWGLLFIYWVVPSVVHGEAHLVGPVSREKDPVLFWAIVSLWAIFGVLLVLADVAPDFIATYQLG